MAFKCQGESEPAHSNTPLMDGAGTLHWSAMTNEEFECRDFVQRFVTNPGCAWFVLHVLKLKNWEFEYYLSPYDKEILLLLKEF